LRAARFTPDGKRLLAGSSAGGEVKLVAWDAATGKQLASAGDKGLEANSFRVRSGGDTITDIAIAPDGSRVAVAHKGGVTVLHDAATLKPQRILNGGQREVGAVAFSPDGKTVAAGSKDGKITLWRL
jgi:WD40 repeat protein